VEAKQQQKELEDAMFSLSDEESQVCVCVDIWVHAHNHES
jgi:hypothetical protein